MTPDSLSGVFVIFAGTLVLAEASRHLGLRGGIVRPRLFGRRRGQLAPALGGLPLLFGFAPALLFFLGPWRPAPLPEDILRGEAEMFRLSLGVCLAGALLFVEGYYADTRTHRRLRTAAAYLLAAACMVGFGFVVDRLSLGACDLTLGRWGPPATVLYIAALLVFFRSMDGIPGLPTGLAALILALQLVLLSGAEEGLASEFCIILALVLAASFIMEAPPTRLALGRNGHALPGLLVAASTILTRQKTFVAAALFVPAVVIVIGAGLVALTILEQRLLFRDRRMR